MKLDRQFMMTLGLFVLSSTNCLAQGPNNSGEY